MVFTFPPRPPMVGPPPAALQVDAREHQHVESQQEAPGPDGHPQRHRVAVKRKTILDSILCPFKLSFDFYIDKSYI